MLSVTSTMLEEAMGTHSISLAQRLKLFFITKTTANAPITTPARTRDSKADIDDVGEAGGEGMANIDQVLRPSDSSWNG